MCKLIYTNKQPALNKSKLEKVTLTLMLNYREGLMKKHCSYKLLYVDEVIEVKNVSETVNLACFISNTLFHEEKPFVRLQMI